MTREIGRWEQAGGLPEWARALTDEMAGYHRETFEHNDRVGTLTSRLWQEYISLPQQKGTLFRITPFTMYVAGILHDIGKKDIPLEIIDKPGRLDTEEASVMVQHTEIGYETVKPFDPTIAQIIRGHHAYGKNGLVYDHDLARTADPEINAAQLVMAIADKTDASYHRGPHGQNRPMEEVSALLYTQFAHELAEGLVSEDLLILAMRYAEELGSA